MRELARTLVRPDLPELVPGRVGGPRARSPTDGGALLVANHAGAIPSDAPAIMHGIETELERPVYGLADHLFKSLPVVGTLWSRVGGVVAHPDNAYRLLREQRAARAGVPRGHQGHRQDYSERYRLRRFGRGGFVEIAMRAGVPVIPIAVVGAEESMPILCKINAAGQGPRPALLARSPPTCCVSARSGLVALLPGQVQAPGARPGALRRRARPGALLASRIMDESRGHPRSHPGRALRHAPQRRRWFGLEAADMGRRVLITGLGTFWGGLVAQAARGRPRRRRHRRARHPRARGRARAHRVRPRGRELLDPRPHREGHAGRHDRAHLPRRRLHADVVPDDARDQRHRHHEPVRRRLGGRQHGPQRRGEVVGARLRRRPGGPVWFREDMPRGPLPADRRRAQPRSRSRATCATSPWTTPT